MASAKFVTTSNSLAVTATYGQVKNAKKSLEAAHGRYLNTGLALREYQTVLADCHSAPTRPLPGRRAPTGSATTHSAR